MKKAYRFTALFLTLCICLTLFGCSHDTPPTGHDTTTPDIPQSPDTTAPIIPAEPITYDVIEKKLIRSAFDWQRGKYQTDTGELVRWDTPNAEVIDINLLNVFPPGVSSDLSTFIHGGSLVPQYGEFIMQYNAAGLEQSHKQGTKIISSLPMILINRAVYENAGMRVEDYCAIYPNGEVYDGGCLNNPNFRKLIYDYTMLSANHGFDGMFCDGSPYSYGPGYCCCCQYCHAAWEKYSLEKLGTAEPLPTTPPKHDTPVSRCFFDFRAETFLNFVLLLRDDARKLHPEFDIWPNVGLNGALVMSYLNGGLDTVITEFGSSSLLECGEDSTLYLYRQYEAIYEHMPLLAQHNSIAEQAPNPYQFYTCYAEALAGGGNLMVPIGGQVISTYRPTIIKYNKMVDENIEAFTQSTSIAETAVLFSMKDINAYAFNKTGLIPLKANNARRAAALLASNGIPYDYIVAEKETLSQKDLEQYKIIVIPQLILLDTKLEGMLHDFVRAGGKLLILGSKFAVNYIGENGYDHHAYAYDVFEKMTGVKYEDTKPGVAYPCGEGELVVCRLYAANVADEETLKPTNALLECFETIGIRNQVNVTGVANGKVETTIRSNADGSRWWLHLINYSTGGKIAETPYTVTVAIPAGQTVTNVVPSCVFRDLNKMQFSWDFKDGLLTVSGIFDIHTMLTIHKT